MVDFGRPSWFRLTSNGQPTCLWRDKACSSRGHRRLLCSRGIRAVIPQPGDQAGHRKTEGCHGGRPVSYDIEGGKQSNAVGRFFDRMKNWRGLASRYDKHAVTYRGASSSPPSWTGCDDFRDPP